jgi:hypothetical protein
MAARREPRGSESHARLMNALAPLPAACVAMGADNNDSRLQPVGSPLSGYEKVLRFLCGSGRAANEGFDAFARQVRSE